MCMKGIELFHTLFIYLMWSTHEKACETESELLLQLMWTYVKPHVKYMWKCVWKGLHCFTPFSHNFHIYFTMLNFTHMKYVREIHVKRTEKHVKSVWKWHIFHTFFHRIFHIHTPSSVKASKMGARGRSQIRATLALLFWPGRITRWCTFCPPSTLQIKCPWFSRTRGFG